jgi:hypothetical protein
MGFLLSLQHFVGFDAIQFAEFVDGGAVALGDFAEF